ncbi:MAG: glycosyltransferase family 39 protein [Deltaproteobacteria bacterium]|nr:glycosyltransferase family 39 protein [Deltaproteobacteria bacterium]
MTFNFKNIQSIGIWLSLAFLLFGALHTRDLWAPDEPRYATVAREMTETGEWLVPHFNGDIYSGKPPLYFWLEALSAKLFGGFSEFTVRLPSALAGFACLLLIFWFGRENFSPKAGILATLILALSPEFLWNAHTAHLDTTFSLFITFALILFYQGWSQGKLKSFLYGVWFFAGIAALAKGPTSFILVGLVTLSFLLWQKDWQAIRKLLFPLPVIIGSAIYWGWVLLAGEHAGWDYVYNNVIWQNFGRVHNSFDHANPWYTYFLLFPGSFFPWIFFLLAAFHTAWKEKKPRTQFLAVWFIAIFIFFSFMSGKRTLYLLPLMPAAALWVAHELEGNYHRRFIRIAFLLSYGLMMLFGVALPLPFMAHPYGVPLFCLSLFVGLGCLSIGILGIRASYSHRFVKSLQGLLLAMAFIGISVGQGVYRYVNPYKSARELSEQLLVHRQEEEPVCLYGTYNNGSFNFYTGLSFVTVNNEQELQTFLSNFPKVLCIAEGKSWARLNPQLQQEFTSLASDTVGHRSYILLVRKVR